MVVKWSILIWNHPWLLQREGWEKSTLKRSTIISWNQCFMNDEIFLLVLWRCYYSCFTCWDLLHLCAPDWDSLTQGFLQATIYTRALHQSVFSYHRITEAILSQFDNMWGCVLYSKYLIEDWVARHYTAWQLFSIGKPIEILLNLMSTSL